MGLKEREKILFTMCWTFRKVMWGLAKSMLAFVKLFHTSNLFTTLKSGRNLVFTTME